jgi:hypothetical protein
MTAGEVGRRSVGSAYTFAVRLGMHLATMVRALRGRHLVVIDLAAILASIYLALSLRFDGPLDCRQARRFADGDVYGCAGRRRTSPRHHGADGPERRSRTVVNVRARI